MPTYRVEWRPAAVDDLLAIVRYIGRDNPARARSFGDQLREKTQLLHHHPRLGRVGRVEDTRELVAHPNYIVIYRVLEKTRTVQILRVKHSAQQFP